MKLRARAAVIVLVASLATERAHALVNYDTGQRMIDGVQLLQDVTDPLAYYYVPQFPRLARKADGQTLEFLCLKYVSPRGTNGGLFHALIEFTLPPEAITQLEKKLQKDVGGNARIVGPVPLMQATENGEEGGVGSFSVVSAILNDREKDGFTRTLITSGRAPLVPGSKAVVAALLNQEGATLLWESLGKPTSDVSVAIRAYYEAAVRGYNAKVTADVSTVYRHFSMIRNEQQDYSRRQIRNVVDELRRNQALNVEVLDRSQGLGIKTEDMAGILQMVTDKLVELMFDHKSGWSTEPPRETAVEPGQLLGRQERSWLARTFGGTDDTKYYTDDQWVLKRREDIRINTFSMTLSKSTTIKVPVDTAGNLGGLYAALKDDARYFQVVNLDDVAFESRPVHFQVDGNYVDSFQDAINFVSVNVRKTYADAPALTKSLKFTHADVKDGKTIQDIVIPRLGATGADWQAYEYQVRWSLRDGQTVGIPKAADAWLKSSDPVIALVPPFEKRVIEVDADRALFTERGYASAVIDVATVLAGKPRAQKKAVLRATDAEATVKMAVAHDRGTPIAVRVTWYSKGGSVEGKLQVLDNDYLYLVPPEPASASGDVP
jgi:hypothetical protein